MSKRIQRQGVLALVTAGLFIGVLVGTIAASLMAAQLYDTGNTTTGLMVLVSAVAFGILSLATGWTLFYRLGGLITERRRAKVK